MGFAFKLVWSEVKDRVLPNLKDILTALILTLLFGLSCGWMLMGGVIFFIISLMLVYVISRIAAVARIILKLNKMRKNVTGLMGSISSLKNAIKK